MKGKGVEIPSFIHIEALQTMDDAFRNMGFDTRFAGFVNPDRNMAFYLVFAPGKPNEPTYVYKHIGAGFMKVDVNDAKVC